VIPGRTKAQGNARRHLFSTSSLLVLIPLRMDGPLRLSGPLPARPCRLRAHRNA
jgi:hypothetical protein